jgi:hypothetical protein
MPHFDSGVYVYTFTPVIKGNYTINCDDYMYDVHDSFSLEAYDESDVGLVAAKGQTFTFKFLVLNQAGERVIGAHPTIQIIDDVTGEFWTGNAWLAVATAINMSEFGDGLYTYNFIPDRSGTFTIHCDEGTYNLHDSYSLKVVDFTETTGAEPILVNSDTILGQDGGSSYVVDENNIAIPGASVTAYDMDRNTNTKVVTFRDGSWTMYLKPGRYVIMFEKDGYVSVSIERVIA